MLKAIKELGEIKLKREQKTVLSILTEDPNKDGNCPKALVAILKKKDEIFEYSYIRLEDISNDKIDKYLYKRGASQGPDYTITSKITEIEKFFNNKVEGWLNKYGCKDPLFYKIKKALEESKEKIILDLKEKYKEVKSFLKKQEGCLFTLAFEENGGLKYIGDYKAFQDLLINSVSEDYSKIIKTNHICSLCGEKKQEVYGGALAKVFKFYTLDKPGYIAGGFREDLSWRNAPICFNCILYLEEGKKYVDKFLKHKMGGETYYLIPKFILGVKGTEDIIDVFFKYIFQREEIFKKISKISEDEKEILEELGKLKDVLTYNFLFFKSPNPQVFKINLLVEDVLPSRISEIFDAKKEVDKREVFKNVKIGKSKYINIEFRFDIFRQFAPSYKSFLEVVDKTFRGLRIDSTLMFSWFMEEIRKNFVNEENRKNLKLLVLKALICYLFFERLEILDKREYNPEIGGKIMNNLKDSTEKFFNEYSGTFPTPAHKAIFLLGGLCQKLLNIQFQARKSMPFLKNLKSLKMKEEDFKGLFPKIQNKLEEYKKNYYGSLESLIAEYFIEAGSRWGISTDELNFCFVLGMNLHNKISEILKIKEEEQNE